MNVEPLTESTDVLSFDCGDDDLNDFLPVMQSEPNEITKTMYFDMLQIQ